MCGRYVSISTPEQLVTRFGVDEVRTQALPPRYNVAPTLDVYAVIDRRGRRRLGTLRWGLVPPWAATLTGGRRPINARAEGITDKRLFASAFARRRCVLPADGFYEWQRIGDGDGPRRARKQPWFIRDPDGHPLAFAGIWTVWRDPNAAEDAESVFSCAIVTTRAVGRMAQLHPRMPVVLPPRLWDEWLDAEATESEHLHEVILALQPPPLEALVVGTRVNDVRNEGPELLTPGARP